MERLSFILSIALISVTFSQEVIFNRDIRPILSNKCFFCHGPDEKTREADLRLDTREGAIEDHDGFFAIVPGKPDESILLYRIESEDPGIAMPSVGKNLVPIEAAELIRAWIEQLD